MKLIDTVTHFRVSGDIVPLLALTGNGPVVGRYVMFDCLSYYGWGCAIHYIGVGLETM